MKMKDLAAFLFVVHMIAICTAQTSGEQGIKMVGGNDLSSLVAKFMKLWGEKGSGEDKVLKYLQLAEALIPGISKAYKATKGNDIMEKLKALIPFIISKIPALAGLMGDRKSIGGSSNEFSESKPPPYNIKL